MKEYRIAEIRAAAEAAADAEALILEGVAILFDTPTTIHGEDGDYIEIIKPEALKAADLSDSHLFYNHDLNRVPLARTPKTLKLNVDNKGLSFRAMLPDTEDARAIHTAVKRGDLSGVSFGFTVPEGGDSYDPKTNTRTINKISKLFEISVVPFPAYPQTSVEARSQQQAATANYKAKQNLIMLCNTILRKEV